ncbi:Pca regulon regulatory protein PcaR [Klebsiella quasipneumoniae]|nr:Pca regulon regulatory protein PcaR [Klebsiella quasipneumoniae]
MSCSPGCWRWAMPISPAPRWRKWPQTALDSLGKALGESCSAATLDGDNVLYIARAAVNNLLSVDIGRGSRLPAWATSMGRVLLSALPEEQLEVTLSRAVLIRYTPHTLCDMAGYARRLIGCACRAMPLRRPADRGGPVLAGGAGAVASWPGGGRAECRGAGRDGQRRGVKREGPRPATPRGDGPVATAIAPSAASSPWRGCARSRRPAAEA